MKKERRLVYCICKARRVWASGSERIKKFTWESEEKKYKQVIGRLKVFRIVKNCDRGLETATRGRIRTFQQQITYIYVIQEN